MYQLDWVPTCVRVVQLAANQLPLLKRTEVTVATNRPVGQLGNPVASHRQ